MFSKLFKIYIIIYFILSSNLCFGYDLKKYFYDVSKIKISDLSKTFIAFDYNNINKNKDINFLIIFPKSYKIEILDKTDPKKFKNEKPVSLILLHNDNYDISGTIFVFNTERKLQSDKFGYFMLKELFKDSEIIKNNSRNFNYESWGDFLIISKNGEISRAVTRRNEENYYLYIVTAKNKNIYKKNEKDIALSLYNFTIKNQNEKEYVANYKKTNINNFFIYIPESWNINKINKEKYQIFNSSNGNILFYIKDGNSQDIEKYFEEFKELLIKKNKNFNLELKSADKENHILFYGVLKNKTNIKDSILIKGKIFIKNDKIILITLLNVFEKQDYLSYHENNQIFDIIINNIGIKQ